MLLLLSAYNLIHLFSICFFLEGPRCEQCPSPATQTGIELLLKMNKKIGRIECLMFILPFCSFLERKVRVPSAPERPGPSTVRKFADGHCEIGWSGTWGPNLAD